jgi:spermidine synthase
VSVTRRQSPFHEMKITDVNGVRVLKFERAHQSSMRLDDPYLTDIEYIDYFHIALAIRPRIKRTLIVGLGGGSLAKRLWHDHPSMRIDAIEIDAEVAKIAYELFDLPRDDRIQVSIADGRAFLSDSSATYDYIVIDAFDDDSIPPHLLTDEFLRLCRDHLAENGVIAYNVIGSIHGDQSRPFRSFYRTISNVWGTVLPFSVGLAANGPIQLAFGGNMVIFATDAVVDRERLPRMIATLGERFGVPPRVALLGEDLYTTPIRSGDVPLLIDPR